MAFTFGGSPPSGSSGVLVAFIEGDAARELGREAPETGPKVIGDALTAFSGPRAAGPRDALTSLDTRLSAHPEA